MTDEPAPQVVIQAPGLTRATLLLKADDGPTHEIAYALLTNSTQAVRDVVHLLRTVAEELEHNSAVGEVVMQDVFGIDVAGYGLG